MILDGYWKRDLFRIRLSLLFGGRFGTIFGNEYASHIINKGLLYSSAIIRKIAEDEKDAESVIKINNWKLPELPVIQLEVPFMFYPHVDPDKFFVNGKLCLEDYDLHAGTSKDISIFAACNQIIHSYVWQTVNRKKFGIYGVFFASDREKEKGVYFLTIENWIKVLKKVIKESTI